MVQGALFRGIFRPALESPHFPEAARRIGFAELWDPYGPPDMCHKAANGDWLCAVKK